MEGITLGQISVGIALLVALITGIKYLSSSIKEGVTALFRDEFKSLDGKFQALDERMKKLEEKIDGVDSKLEKRIDNVDMESCKNFLVGRISHVEKGTPLSEVEAERFWEQYDYYIKHQGNSYVRRKVEQLKEEGKL